MDIERIVYRAEKLKEKSQYLLSLRLFKRAFQRYTKMCDIEGILHCMLSMGDIQRIRGNFDLAAKHYSEAIEFSRKYKKMIWLSDARVGLALSLRAQGKWQDARNLIRKSMNMYRKENDREGLAFSLWAEAGAMRIGGRIREAIRTFKDSLRVYKTIRNTDGIGFCLCGLGGAFRVAGKFKESFISYTAANNLFFHNKNIFGLAYSYCGIGNAYRMMKDYRGALFNFKKATRLYKKIGDTVSYAYTLWGIGTTYKMLGDLKKSHDNFTQAMFIFSRTKDPRGIIYSRLGLAELDFLKDRKVQSMRQLNNALYESKKNNFALEKCHAKTIIFFTHGKSGSRCYNKLGLKLKFQGLPLNIP